MPTLVMMHGMTGTAEMMRPFAEKILPLGWELIVPEASFEHPNRGFTWWRYENGDQPGRRILTATELSEVLVAVGLAQNMGALRALATEGIQEGHMALHARTIAIAAGAKGSNIALVSKHIVDKGNITLEEATLFLKNQTKDTF